MKRTNFLVLFLLWQIDSVAQQDPQYTQYIYNPSVINPAYTINETGVLNFGTLYRSQWTNVEGAPKTLTFFAHTAFNKKVETGISFISDNIGNGVLKENNIYADFAYILQLNAKSNVALGLKGGFTSFEANFNGFVLPEFQDDDAFNENINRIFPNVGIGTFYNKSNFYVGISAPNLLTTKHLDNQNELKRIGSEAIHLFLTSGYVYTLSSIIKIKPSFMAKTALGSPISFDTSLNVLFNNRFEGGLSYRFEDAISAMFNMSITPSIRMGYSYDHTISNLESFSSGSHEIFALFNLNFFSLKKGYDKSPRFY
ncbi:type IX secretion system membrane protein PorP/SprF [Flagellimonas onchidii]|uniref:PorP/SprF family type IX secretion system membrane protein n=1 Tax=Flagellimonas onchidii TaxID=2562684 RepID=UPI0010A6B62C|nr:type IX secretion system membrane protein PorP/SprF [Allomuricauda onchidii]